MNKVFVLLPQTLIRMWGINFLPETKFYQFEYPIRYQSDEKIKNTIYEINELLLKEINYKFSSIIEIGKNYSLNTLDTIIDSQILTLKKYYTIIDNQKNLEVVNYVSNELLTIKWSDISTLSNFSRGLIRSGRLKKKFNPKVVWSWHYILSGNNKSLTDHFWMNKALNHHQIITTCEKFINNNIDLLPELKTIHKNDRILLILPPHDVTYNDFLVNLKTKLETCKQLGEDFPLFDTILVKQHRMAKYEFPKSFIVKEKNIFNLNSRISKVMPVEIILHSFKNITLLSAPTSAMYVRDDIPVYRLTEVNRDEKKELGLLLYRSKRKSKFIS